MRKCGMSLVPPQCSNAAPKPGNQDGKPGCAPHQASVGSLSRRRVVPGADMDRNEPGTPPIGDRRINSVATTTTTTAAAVDALFAIFSTDGGEVVIAGSGAYIDFIAIHARR